MRIQKCRPLTTVALIGAVLWGSQAIAAQRDSTDFNFQYNGDRLPSEEGYTHIGTFSTEPISDGDILTYRTGISSSSGYFQNSSEWATNISNAVGWTLEFRIKLEDDFNAAEGGAVQFFLADSMGYRIFRLKKDRFFTTLTGASDGEFSNENNADGFHTFRIAREAGSADWLAWRDGVLVGTPIGGISASNDFWWGDGSSGIGGPTIRVDYVRYDTTGAYTPPSSQSPGDFNDDGFVNSTDLNLWSTNFGASSGATFAMGDADGDSDIDGSDFLIWQANVGTAGGASAVPEPSVLALLAIAFSGVLCRRRVA